MISTGLLIIDMQNAYFANEALAKQKNRLVVACNQLIDKAASSGAPVFVVLTEHDRDIATWTLNMIADKQGYLYTGSDDSQIISGLQHAGSVTVIKTRDSAFFGTMLANMLHTRGISQLVLAGVSTHTCVAQTAADAYAHNFAVTIATDAVASHQPRWHQTALDMLELEYRQTLRRVNEITFL